MLQYGGKQTGWFIGRNLLPKRITSENASIDLTTDMNGVAFCLIALEYEAISSSRVHEVDVEVQKDHSEGSTLAEYRFL
jgi:hypothetical protein